MLPEQCSFLSLDPFVDVADFDLNFRRVFVDFRRSESDDVAAYESFVYSIFRLFDPSVDTDHNSNFHPFAENPKANAIEINAGVGSQTERKVEVTSSSTSSHGSKFNIFKKLTSASHEKKDDKKKKKEDEKHNKSDPSVTADAEDGSHGAESYPPRNIGDGTYSLIHVITEAVKVYVNTVSEPSLLFRDESALIEIIRKFMKREGDAFVTFMIAPLFVTILHDGYTVSLDDSVTKKKGKSDGRSSSAHPPRGDSFDFSERAVVRLKSGNQGSSNSSIRREASSNDGPENVFLPRTIPIKDYKSSEGGESSFVHPQGKVAKEYKSADEDRLRGREEKLFDQLFKEKKRSPGPADVMRSAQKYCESPLSVDNSDRMLEKNRDRFLWICRSFLSRLYNSVPRIPRSIRLLIQSIVGVVCQKFPGQDVANHLTSCLFFLRFLCPEVIARKTAMEMEVRKSAGMADKLMGVEQTLMFFVKFLQYLANGNWDAAGRMGFCNDTLKNESVNILVHLQMKMVFCFINPNYHFKDFYASLQKDDPSAMEMRDFQVWLHSTQIQRVLPIAPPTSLSLLDSVQVFADIHSKPSPQRREGDDDVDEVERVLVKGLGDAILGRMAMVSQGRK